MILQTRLKHIEKIKDKFFFSRQYIINTLEKLRLESNSCL